MRSDTRQKIIFHYDNALPHVAISVKNYLENSGWEVLPHPPYSPDLAPYDYHLFQSMQNALIGIRFVWDVIHKFPERWVKVIASDGQYFE